MRRGPNQTNELIQILSEVPEILGGVEVNGQFFGDAHLMTGVFFPELDADNELAAASNAAAIQACIDAAGSGTTIRLPNFRFYCDQLNIPPGKPNLIIEGSGGTVIINRAGDFPNNNYVVFKGFADRIADAVGMTNYLPGGASQTSFTAYSIGGGNPGNFAAGDFMYAFIPIVNQTIAESRTAQMIEIAAVQANGDDMDVTLEEAILAQMGAPEAEAVVVDGEVTDITVVEKGGAYYSAFYEDAIHHPRVIIEEPPGMGTPAQALIILNAPLQKFHITNRGSGYETAPTVAINPQNGATATAFLEDGEVDRIEINNAGAGFEQSPEITLNDGNPVTPASAVVTIGPSDSLQINIDNPGAGYSSMDPPEVTIDPPLYQAKYLRGGTKVSSISRQTVTLFPTSRATEENYPIGSIVWLCNGPTFTDADGQYFRVLAVPGGGVIELDRTVRQEDFRENLTCLVKGPFIERLTIRNLQIGGLDATFGFNAILLSGVYGLTVENVQMVPGDPDLIPDHFYFTKTQFVCIRNYEGLVTWQTSHNCSIQDSRLMGLVTHSNAKDFTIERCIIGGDLRLWYYSERFTFRDCQFTQSGPSSEVDDVFFASEESSDFVFENCTIYSMGMDWVFRVPRLRISNTRFLAGTTLTIGEECTNCVLENVTLPTSALSIDSGSTGRMSNVQPDPGPVEGWFSDNSWVKVPERTVPASPVEVSAVVFARNSGGKTQLCALFNSGDPVQIAIEP